MTTEMRWRAAAAPLALVAMMACSPAPETDPADAPPATLDTQDPAARPDDALGRPVDADTARLDTAVPMPLPRAEPAGPGTPPPGSARPQPPRAEDPAIDPPMPLPPVEPAPPR
jgi:hypothetical protein